MRSKANFVYAMDFVENKYISAPFCHNKLDTDKLVDMIAECIQKYKNLDTILIMLESNSIYSGRIDRTKKLEP